MDRVTGFTVRKCSSERSRDEVTAVIARCRAALDIFSELALSFGPIASRGTFDSKRNCVKPVGLDCARHVRERSEGDFLAGRALERVDEVRVIEALGSDAETARAESANCNAGDGTAELRQVLTGKAALPEPLLSDGVVGMGGLTEFVDGNLDLAGQMLMR